MLMACLRAGSDWVSFADDTEIIVCPAAGLDEARGVAALIKAHAGARATVHAYGYFERPTAGEARHVWYIVGATFEARRHAAVEELCAAAGLRMCQGWATFCDPSEYVTQMRHPSIPVERSYVAYAGRSGGWGPFPALPGSAVATPPVEFGVFAWRVTNKGQTAGVLPY